MNLKYEAIFQPIALRSGAELSNRTGWFPVID